MKRVFIDGYYGWGVGYYSSKSYKNFEKLVNIFCKEQQLDLSVQQSDGICAEVGDNVEGIYFHPMEVVFKGDYEIFAERFAELVNSQPDEEVRKVFAVLN